MAVWLYLVLVGFLSSIFSLCLLHFGLQDLELYT